MAKDELFFVETADQDEIDEIERQIQQRRLAVYSKDALKAGMEVDRIVVLHDDFQKAVKAFDRMFQLSREFSMPQGGILVGEHGSGHKALCRWFEDRVPGSGLYSAGHGFLRVNMSGAPSVGQLVASLLRRCGYPFYKGSEAQLTMRRDIVRDLIDAKGTRLIYFGNAHRMVAQGPSTRTGDEYRYNPNVVDFIGELMDETRVAVVLGGSDRLDKLLQASTQLGKRLTVRMELRRFQPDRNWRALVRAFVTECKVCDLGFVDTDAEAKRLHTMTKGCIQELKRVLTEAVMIATQKRATRIDESHLREAIDVISGFAHLLTNTYGAPNRPA